MILGKFKKNAVLGIGALLFGAVGIAYSQPAPIKTNIKKVLLYDYAVSGGHGTSRTALRNSMQKLAAKYGFTLTMTDKPSDITAANLTGVQVLVTSNGDGDVFTSQAAKTAVENFIEKDGHGLLMVHASGAFIPCPTNGQENLSDAGCLFLARAAVRQYFNHIADGSDASIYVDSTAKGQVPRLANAGTPAATIDHGIKNDETKGIFYPGFPHSMAHMKDEWYSFRASARLLNTDQTFNGVKEGPVNVLLSGDEALFTSSTKMGDHPLAWTRKMGNGLVAFNSIGHDATAGQVIFEQQDSVIQRFHWQLMRYMAKDFVGCMDKTSSTYNPEATVTTLTPNDNAAPCAPTKTFNLTTERAGSPQNFGITNSPGALSIKLNETGFHKISVMDVKGHQVYSAEKVIGPGNVDVSNLKEGTFFVRVSSAKHSEVKRVNLF